MKNNVTLKELLDILQTAEEDNEITVEVDGKEYSISDFDWVTDNRLILRIRKD